MITQQRPKLLLFLGDGLRDISAAHCGDTEIIAVRGNNDIAVSRPFSRTFDIEGKRFLMAHGHNQGVKAGLLRLSLKAQEKAADYVLFGHTHKPAEIIDQGVIYLNPGSIGFSGDYILMRAEKGCISYEFKRVY